MATLYDRTSAGRPLDAAVPSKVQFVVKTSKFCNLRCSYCYEMPDLGDRTAMRLDQLRHMYESIAEHYYRHDAPVAIEFDWHGGEPLLISPDFYWRTFDEQTRIFDDPKVTVLNYVQTNLTILNDPLIKLLDEGFDGVGVSVDLFSGLRVNVGGRDSQATVLQNMDRLRDAGIPFGCITVLTRRNRPQLGKIFRFFANAGISPRILPVHRGASETQNDADLLSEEEVLDAYIELFEMWIKSEAPILIEPLYSYTESVLAALNGQTELYYDKTSWEPIYVVNTDGNLYSYADLFDPALAHGNVFSDRMTAIVNSRRHRHAIDMAESRMAATCYDCRHYGQACTGYPVAEESLGRRDPKPNGGFGAACTRERGILDYIERRLLQLGIVSATGELDTSSKYFSRFDAALRMPA